MSATNVRRTTGVLLALGLAFALGPPLPSADDPGRERLQLADMGMGPAGPELGGSEDDMVLDDPGHVPAEAQMELQDPGHVPAEAQMDLQDPGHIPAEAQMDLQDPGHIPAEAEMDLQEPMDDDRQDDILE